MTPVDRCAQCGLPTHAGRYCQDCYARRRADAHADECGCRWCARATLAREGQRLREDARAHGGLRADFISLLGDIDL